MVNKTIRGLDQSLIREINFACLDEGRTQGEVINEAMMLWLKKYEQRKARRKKK